MVGFFGHAVGETNKDLKALIGAAKEFAGPGFLLPTRNGELFRWCLSNGLRIAQPMTLMSKGLYNEPAGSIPAIDLVLAKFGGFPTGTAWNTNCVINLFERILARRGYRFAGGHRHRN